jgi:CubicO group peptidase (beta-lactamase class C family)
MEPRLSRGISPEAAEAAGLRPAALKELVTGVERALEPGSGTPPRALGAGSGTPPRAPEAGSGTPVPAQEADLAPPARAAQTPAPPLAETPAPLARPWCAGAVVLAGRGDVVALHEARGWALRWAGHDTELPRERWVPVRPDTVFDLASLTKPFTAVVALQQVAAGALELDAPVAAGLPEFRAAGKAGITVRQLLTHTSGLRPEAPFHAEPDAAGRRALLAREAPVTEPGSTQTYSDLNMIALAWLLEDVTGRPLDALAGDGITGPLGMTDTCFNPPPAWRGRIAATEDQRPPWGRLDRGLVHGTVHDENAHAMGGVAGHAGLFSTAWDLALFCRALLDGTLLPAAAALPGGPLPADPLLGAVPGLPGPPRGLVLDVDRRWFMGALSGPRTAGHTGFTGTSLVVDPVSDSFLVLLTNSVHPCRLWRTGNAPRVAAADALARALL